MCEAWLFAQEKREKKKNPHYITPHCTILHHTIWNYRTPHYSTLNFTTLQYPTPHHTSTTILRENTCCTHNSGVHYTILHNIAANSPRWSCDCWRLPRCGSCQARGWPWCAQTPCTPARCRHALPAPPCLLAPSFCASFPTKTHEKKNTEAILRQPLL